MPVRSTSLSTIISRMQRYPDALQNSNEVNFVLDIDQAIRTIRRLMPLPWTLQKSSLRVFDGVYIYPVANDHDELAYLDVSENTFYPAKAKFKYTSIQQFFEDPNNRNQIAEIFDANQRVLGVNLKNINAGSQIINQAETLSDWTTSGDAGTPVLDQVFFKEGNGSIRVPITNSSNTANIRWALSSVLSDSAYRKKYQFVWVYFSSAPTSIELRLETDASNYLATSSISTQFDGTPFKAGQWNLIAQDLNTASETGTFNSSSIAYGRLILTGAATGTYYIDASYLRSWQLLDYWYYSIYSIITSTGTVATKEYFYDDTSSSYDTTDKVIGDSEWIDIIMFDAILTNLSIIKASKESKQDVKDWRDAAWESLIKKYPSLEPIIITDRYNFETDFVDPGIIQ